jgi:alginate O-acetyltransferase complex protein AlgI
MIFSSALFLGLFLPLFLVVYYLAPARWRSPVILAGSYLFYAWWRIDFTFLFAGVTFVTYLISIKIERAATPQKAKHWLWGGVVANLLTLGYFKYFNFGVESWNLLFQTDWQGWRVILPIGVSFYVFHCISYLVDVYRKDAEVAKSYWDFAAFTALFPHLIAGPVLRYKDLAWQFQSRTHSLEKFNEGVIRFALGFAKKVMIADTLAPLADGMFALQNPSLMESWLGILAYTAQLYFDFSGYSDMAVGLALMMGFRFIENFNQPYLSRSITEFWQRWHISLSTWLRDYLYIPLGGNRKGAIRTYINLFLTMLLGGLWHGANVTFLCWGAWHGFFLALERRLGGKGGTPYPQWIAWPLTCLLAMIGWVLFRAPDMATAIGYYAGMLGFNGVALSDVVAWEVDNAQIATLILAIVLVILPRFTTFRMATAAANLSLGKQIAVMLAFLLATAKLITQTNTPFLYFQF